MSASSTISLTSWNQAAPRFVQAPAFDWTAIPSASHYLVEIATRSEVVQRAKAATPAYDFAECWQALPNGPVDVLISAFDPGGREVAKRCFKRFSKVPGFDGRLQAPLDWRGAVRRNMAYLLAPARDAVAAYEGKMPRGCWSNMEDNNTGIRKHLAYPALHHPSFILAFLAFARTNPEDPLAAEALRQAGQYGDWLLEYHHPDEGVCPRFPFSTIQEGKFEGGNEGRNITLFRAARVGEAMVALHGHSKDRRYLDYARHLAGVYLKLQREDGSWPYRIDPLDGSVAEDYTSNAVTPARFLGMLDELEPDPRYRKARERAFQWVVDHPLQDHYWQGQFEDVRERPRFSNLQHWDTQEAIRYLCHYHRDPAGLRLAEGANGYVENLFVVWQEEDSPLIVRCPTPTVLEQFHCYFPMECHTGTWLLSLLALHEATGRDEYSRKALAAANSIVRGQQPSGAFSTWGNDRRFGKTLNPHDWPGCNAVASTALLYWSEYQQALQAGRPFKLGLRQA